MLKILGNTIKNLVTQDLQAPGRDPLTQSSIKAIFWPKNFMW
jgi:hypothetical protein